MTFTYLSKHRHLTTLARIAFGVIMCVFSIEVLLADGNACCGPEPGTNACYAEGCSHEFPSYCAQRVLDQIRACCGNNSGNATCTRIRACEPGTAWCIVCDFGKVCGTCETESCGGGGGGECDQCSFFASGPDECAVGEEEEQTLIWDSECGCCKESLTPLIMNLRGGIRLSDREHGVLFDFDADGTSELLPWPSGSDEGWLVWDRNENGLIDDGRELFGSATVLSTGATAANGFLALAEADKNGDGVLTAEDPAFAAIGVWLDIQRDGVSDRLELVSLSELGVTSIGVTYSASSRRDRDGNYYSTERQCCSRTGHIASFMMSI